jgi:ApaG protein
MISEPTDDYDSETVTRGLRVSVCARYDPVRSSPQQSQWFFLYTVTLTNEGEETLQLLTRHWIIQDGRGRIEEVRGDGVVGDTPILAPGESYEYTSGCPLTTDFGSMRGSYGMVTDAGERFDADIAEFVLTVSDGVVN